MTEKVPVVPALKKVDIEERAAAIIQQFDPEGFSGFRPVAIEGIFEFDLKNMPGLQGFRTGYRDLNYLGLGTYGYTDAVKKESLVHSELVDDMSKAGNRIYRSTVAHECAHCILHVPVLQVFYSISADGSLLRRAKRQDIPAYIDPEWQAWTMGGALLMPRHLVSQSYSNSESVYEMADRFNVNPAFVRSRLKILGLQER